MSIVLQSSNGGSVTIQEPATASNFTQNLPAAAGTVMVSGNMPAFSASMGNNQSITNGVWTKANFNTEAFDTANCYDPTTNYRFTPNVAGYYQVNTAVAIVAASNVTGFGIAVYKNGTPVQYFYRAANATNGTTDAYPSGSFLVYCNGSTDYLELYGYGAGTSPSLIASSTQSCFQAYLVRT